MDELLIETAMKAIRDYLRTRPDAADTVEGIHEWWITWPGEAEPLTITRAALERLEAGGELERRRIGKRELWRARREG
ncbi:hypothetical protein [Chitiniphilus eburneus]|uniref:DUF3253 domain-containing protein n=1 Tax=Chitiniphilus eburneus TaxID=2571148 RepID=A0A4U0Q3E4_9NEIS|nr:hypothetical protein [Chitiniphilus eburneus]TJZ75495.1 hypothetical protein FAZ21_06145 [Chitiniphilus eburneus]